MTCLQESGRKTVDNESDLQTIIDGAGPITGLFVLLVGIAVVLLVLNMNRQMKKIDSDLPEGADEKRVNEELDEIAELEEPNDPKG